MYSLTTPSLVSSSLLTLSTLLLVRFMIFFSYLSIEVRRSICLRYLFYILV